MSACSHCDDTGSLSKQLIGYLDCAHCEVATERTMLELWAVKNVSNCNDLNEVWMIYRLGQKSITNPEK